MVIRREIGQRLTATVPRILATILNETIVAGIVVLLHRCRTARLVRCRALRPVALLDPGCVKRRFGRIFGLDGRESYRELRLELLCCPHRLSRGTAPHEREYPRRKGSF